VGERLACFPGEIGGGVVAVKGAQDGGDGERREDARCTDQPAERGGWGE
jgi:hypothetical protein